MACFLKGVSRDSYRTPGTIPGDMLRGLILNTTRWGGRPSEALRQPQSHHMQISNSTYAIFESNLIQFGFVPKAKKYVCSPLAFSRGQAPASTMQKSMNLCEYCSVLLCSHTLVAFSGCGNALQIYKASGATATSEWPKTITWTPPGAFRFAILDCTTTMKTNQNDKFDGLQPIKTKH